MISSVSSACEKKYIKRYNAALFFASPISHKDVLALCSAPRHESVSLIPRIQQSDSLTVCDASPTECYSN